MIGIHARSLAKRSAFRSAKRRRHDIDLDEVRPQLERRREEIRERIAALAARPELGAAQGFGKRVGDGTVEAISRLVSDNFATFYDAYRTWITRGLAPRSWRMLKWRWSPPSTRKRPPGNALQPTRRQRHPVQTLCPQAPVLRIDLHGIKRARAVGQLAGASRTPHREIPGEIRRPRDTLQTLAFAGLLRCRRRDSNPRHADYDSAALTS